MYLTVINGWKPTDLSVFLSKAPLSELPEKMPHAVLNNCPKYGYGMDPISMLMSFWRRAYYLRDLPKLGIIGGSNMLMGSYQGKRVACGQGSEVCYEERNKGHGITLYKGMLWAARYRKIAHFSQHPLLERTSPTSESAKRCYTSLEQRGFLKLLSHEHITGHAWDQGIPLYKIQQIPSDINIEVVRFKGYLPYKE